MNQNWTIWKQYSGSPTNNMNRSHLQTKILKAGGVFLVQPFIGVTIEVQKLLLKQSKGNPTYVSVTQCVTCDEIFPLFVINNVFVPVLSCPWSIERIATEGSLRLAPSLVWLQNTEHYTMYYVYTTQQTQWASYHLTNSGQASSQEYCCS